MPPSLLDNPLASLAGLIALIFLTIWPLFRTRRQILFVQLGASICFMMHYALLGLFAPALVNTLGSIQTLAALQSARHPALNQIGYGLIPLMVAVGIYFWTGPTSALCVTAMALIALGRMQTNEWSLRLLILMGGILWAAHDYLVGSWIALTADLMSLSTGLAMLVSFALAGRPTALQPTATSKALCLSRKTTISNGIGPVGSALSRTRFQPNLKLKTAI